MFPLNLYARVHFVCSKSHARPRVQRAPGLPCALSFEGKEFLAKFGRDAPRDRKIVSILRHCLRQTRSVCARERSDEAIHSYPAVAWIASRSLSSGAHDFMKASAFALIGAVLTYFGGIAVYIMSQASSYHTADCFVIDGGYTAF